MTTQEATTEPGPATTRTASKKAYCPGCGQDKRVTEKGAFFAHDKDGKKAVVNPCPWSGRAPGGEPASTEEQEAMQRATAELRAEHAPEAAPPAEPPEEPPSLTEGLNPATAPEPAHPLGDSDPEPRARPRQRNLAGEPIADDIVVEDVQGSPGKLFSAANYELRVAVDDLEELQKQGSGSREARLELMKKVKARKKALVLSPEVYGRESARLLDRAFNEAL